MLPRLYHYATTMLPRLLTTKLPQQHHDAAPTLPRLYHDSTTILPRYCHDSTTTLPRRCHDRGWSYHALTLLTFSRLEEALACAHLRRVQAFCARGNRWRCPLFPLQKAVLSPANTSSEGSDTGFSPTAGSGPVHGEEQSHDAKNWQGWLARQILWLFIWLPDHTSKVRGLNNESNASNSCWSKLCFITNAVIMRSSMLFVVLTFLCK